MACQMESIDRLTALLRGLAPEATVLLAGPLSTPLICDAADSGAMHLHLVLQGTATLEYSNGQQAVSAPAVFVTMTQGAHSLNPDSAATVVFSMRVEFFGPAAPMIFGENARPCCIDVLAEQDDLHRIVELITQEVDARRCALGIVLDHAAEILLVGVLRRLVAVRALPSGVLAGLGDARLARTLIALHEAPERAWTLELMAETAGMSRTVFANRFRTVMGATPKRYLADFRLMLARKVIDEQKGLKHAARVAGYASPAALSRALSRTRV